MKEWKLLILNTSYKEAEIHFSESQSLGSDENEVDLVLNDTDIPANLLTLNCQEDQVFCQLFKESDGIKIQGVLHDSAVALPSLTAINVGELWFMIAPVEQLWPKKLPVFDKEHTVPNAKTTIKPAGSAYKHVSNIIWLAVLGTVTAAVLLFFDIKAENSQQVDTEELNLSIAQDVLQTENRPHLMIDWDEVDQKISLSGYV